MPVGGMSMARVSSALNVMSMICAGSVKVKVSTQSTE